MKHRAGLEAVVGRYPGGFRSRGESWLAAAMAHHGIRYVYEQPTPIIDHRGRHRVWHPDFTLPDHDGLIVEYAGMPDRPDYMAGIGYKQRVYRSNGRPALFLYPTDLAVRGWPARLVARIGSYASRASADAPGAWSPDASARSSRPSPYR